MNNRSSQKRRRIWLYAGGTLLVLIGGATGALLVAISNMFARDLDDAQFIARRFPADPLVQAAYQAGGRTIHYVRSPNRHAPPVLFLHGSPGSWRNYTSFLADPDLRRQADVIVPDRPGFGETDGPAETSLTRQTELLAPLLELRPDSRFVLVGYSLGGAVAGRLAAEYSEHVRALLLIAPSIDPALEERRWYNWLAAIPPLPSLLPPVLVASNCEIWPLRTELEALKPLWSRIAAPVLVIHGEKDGLVPLENADFAQQVMPQSRVIRVPGVGHFILWEETDLILDALLSLIDVD